ncbi:uncharacterized protein LOC124916061 [Impatiens glandulifera]|uniref:uncharacterized protein LOC124916061 n=1 Tax=Impatiens glandulifera TaxID=253017 RepID=UPI001FB064C2|nr:uncharacterized protein LOC124916061 [Impatiens glandulifera]
MIKKIPLHILESCINGVPPKRKFTEATRKFGYSRQTISAIWKTSMIQIQSGNPINVINRKRVKIQLKRLAFDPEKLKQVQVSKRGTFRSIAKEMDVSKSIVGRWFKEGLIKAHTNAIKSTLNDKNRYNRLKFNLLSLKVDNDQKITKLKSMQLIVHIVEKWFNLTRTNERYYLVPGEEEPYRTCQRKRFITNVMFLCAVARPVYGINGECLFDGKI